MEIAEVNAFVTGAASGIGRETTLALASAGARVTATDLDRAGLDALAEAGAQAKLDIKTAVLDVTDREAYEALARSLGEQ